MGGARTDVEPVAARTGHGRRLTQAFEALEGLPALAESRGRLLRAVRGEPAELNEIVAAIGSDVALAVSVLRLANASEPEVSGVAAAVETLSPTGIERLARAAEVFEFFEAPRAWTAPPERFRAHAVATQHAAERLARATRHGPLDELLTAALLHDVGKLVLGHAYRGYPEQVHGPARTPEERVRREREELGVDHALVGGVLIRRWGLPDRLASAVERHHDDEPDGLAAIVRLADALARFAHGDPVDMEVVVELGRRVGLDREELGALLYDLPYPVTAGRALEGPCPLTARELEVLAQLVEGKVYKQIAQDLNVATSTIRNHLHSTYSKLGVVDKTQAVLAAKERGWI